MVELFLKVPGSAGARITKTSLHWAPDKRNSLPHAFQITQMIEDGPCGTRTAPLGRAVPGMRRSNWRRLPDRALLAHVLRHARVLLSGCLLGIVLCAPLAADTTETAAPTPQPPAATPQR